MTVAVTVDCDIAIIGAGAAGLATAIFVREAAHPPDVLLLDGARRPGAKILVSGGSRCNVTNAQVSAADYHGGSRAAVARVLAGFDVPTTIAFFARLGVPLREEPLGKLFPQSNRSRDVLEALLHEAERLGVRRRDGTRVVGLTRLDEGFLLETTAGPLRARRVVLATGGLALPKSGSDGLGLSLATALGHTVVPPVPALVPLVLDATRSPHERLSGVAHHAGIAVWIDGRLRTRIDGQLLWTHTGLSGPLALDTSRHWARATHDGHAVRLALHVRPWLSWDAMDATWQQQLAERPRATLQTLLGDWLPGSVASALLEEAGLMPTAAASSVTRDARRRLVQTLTDWTIPVTGTRGFTHAEVTAGGVPLSEVDTASMASRRCPGLYLAGEVLDVDGRLGGFNFQWAWSSAAAAARGILRVDRPAGVEQ